MSTTVRSFFTLLSVSARWQWTELRPPPGLERGRLVDWHVCEDEPGYERVIIARWEVEEKTE